jgi:hypothetical protein
MPRKKNSGSKGKLERDEFHKYFLDGKPIPGVTEVISGCGLSDFSMVRQEVLELAQLRGTFVHRTCEFFDQGDLLEDTLSPVLVPYLEAWKKFRKETGFRPTKIEAMGYSGIHWFAGQVDRIGLIRRKPAIVDIKPPTRHRWWKFQTAAYALIFFAGKIPLRLSVSLLPTGSCRVDSHPVNEFLHDRDVFLAALKIEMEKRKGN